MAFPESTRTVAGAYGVRGVDYAFGMHPALRDATFSVAPGEIHALVGAHHAGKSTLCAVMSGRLIPERGMVLAGGRDFSGLTPQMAKEMGITHLSGRPRIYPRQTVLENIILGDRRRWLGLFPGRRYRRKIKDWLWDNQIVLPLDAKIQEAPYEQWVLVEILSKLYQNPSFLVMDEALEELNQPYFNRVLKLLRRHVDNGMALLFVTHRIEDALSIADRVSVMRHGNVILTSSAKSMERLNLIRLCYAQLDRQDDYFSSQETFRELMRYTEAMLRDLPTAIVILDPKRAARFLNNNGEAIFAGTPREGESLFGRDNARLRELVLGACDSGADEQYHNVPVTAADKRKLIADVRIQSIRENEVNVGTMVIIEDVSFREELRRRLVLSDQLASIGLLAAGVAHEVNNPLEIIGNYLNYLRDDASNPENLEVISRMEEEITRIHAITNSLVSYTGSDGTAREQVDVMALVRETVGLLQFHGGCRSVDFTCRDDGGRALVDANSAELRQVFLNLMRNAIDAMPTGGAVEIASSIITDADGGWVIVTVADTGPGVSLDNPNDVFLPFVSTKKANGSHQGLGLYIVYGIIEKFGGSIKVTNPPGGGCEFRLSFPLAKG
ncbi:MAG: ATP-binding protein [Planctomycetaceae bacterium]|nr:ATP-binding protein [Planctomycetaceae bacterium]